MKETKELYQILEVDETASYAEINAAYKRLTAQIPETDSKHARLVEAYNILSDLDSRAEYDVTGKIKKNSKRSSTSRSTGHIEKARYILNTIFLAGAAVTTIFFILQWSGALSTSPFYWACGISLIIKISEFILRLVP